MTEPHGEPCLICACRMSRRRPGLPHDLRCRPRSRPHGHRHGRAPPTSTTTSAPGPAAPAARLPTPWRTPRWSCCACTTAQACRDVLAACLAVGARHRGGRQHHDGRARRGARPGGDWSSRPGRRTCMPRHGLDPGDRPRRPDDPGRRQAVARGRVGAVACSATPWCSLGPPRRPPSSCVANGVLGDSVASLRRALARGDALGLPRDAVLDVLGAGCARDGSSTAAGTSWARKASGRPRRSPRAPSPRTSTCSRPPPTRCPIARRTSAPCSHGEALDRRRRHRRRRGGRPGPGLAGRRPPRRLARDRRRPGGAAPAARLRADPRDRRPVVPGRRVPPDRAHRGLPRR